MLEAHQLKLEELITCLALEMIGLRKELSKQNDRNNRHKKETFGKKCLKSDTRADDKLGREQEKDDFSDSGSLTLDIPNHQRPIATGLDS